MGGGRLRFELILMGRRPLRVEGDENEDEDEVVDEDDGVMKYDESIIKADYSHTPVEWWERLVIGLLE